MPDLKQVFAFRRSQLFYALSEEAGGYLKSSSQKCVSTLTIVVTEREFGTLTNECLRTRMKAIRYGRF